MFLELLILFTSLLIVFYIGLSIYQKHTSDKIKELASKSMSRYGTLSERDGRHTISLDDQIFEILYIHVPANAELTVNSRYTWDIHQIGKSHIIDQSKRLSSPYPKIVIIFPSTLRIKRYINENEMVFVNYSDKIYDYYLVRLIELEDLMKRLTNHA